MENNPYITWPELKQYRKPGYYLDSVKRKGNTAKGIALFVSGIDAKDYFEIVVEWKE